MQERNLPKKAIRRAPGLSDPFAIVVAKETAPMGKGHRDNHAARKKRGAWAFNRKARRRAKPDGRKKCNLCGTLARIQTMSTGLCAVCFARETGAPIPTVEPDEDE